MVAELAVSPERIDMLVKEVEAIRQQLSEAVKFQGKVEGSVRVLHFFITLGTGAIIAFTVVIYNAMLALDGLKTKMVDFNPVKIELLIKDVATLEEKVNNIDQQIHAPPQPVSRRGH